MMPCKTDRGFYQSTGVINSCCQKYAVVRLVESSSAADHDHVWLFVDSPSEETTAVHLSLKAAKVLRQELRDIIRAIKSRGDSE